MPIARVNGVDLAYEVAGESGPPMVMVHGSWVGGMNWRFVVPGLSETFRVVTFDRRGHMGGVAPRGGTVHDDVEDIVGLIEHLHLGPVHLVGQSYGAALALRFAAVHPELVQSLNVHEPPIGGLLLVDPADATIHSWFENIVGAVRPHLEAGRNEAAVEAFVEGFFPGAWSTLPDPVKTIMSSNGPTFLDEMNDAGSYVADYGLNNITAHTLLTQGSNSPPFFDRILTQVARGVSDSTRYTFPGADHNPQASHPAEFVAKATSWALGT